MPVLVFLMEGEKKMRANAPYLEPLQRKEGKCVIQSGVSSTGRPSIANALGKDDVDES